MLSTYHQNDCMFDSLFWKKQSKIIHKLFGMFYVFPCMQCDLHIVDSDKGTVSQKAIRNVKLGHNFFFI